MVGSHPVPWAGTCTGQMGDGRTTANWPLTAKRTATNASNNLLQLRLCLHLVYAGGSGYPEYPWEHFPSRAKWLGQGKAYRSDGVEKRHTVTPVVHAERAAWRELPTGWYKCAQIPWQHAAYGCVAETCGVGGQVHRYWRYV